MPWKELNKGTLFFQNVESYHDWNVTNRTRLRKVSEVCRWQLYERTSTRRRACSPQRKEKLGLWESGADLWIPQQILPDWAGEMSEVSVSSLPLLLRTRKFYILPLCINLTLWRPVFFMTMAIQYLCVNKVNRLYVVSYTANCLHSHERLTMPPETYLQYFFKFWSECFRISRKCWRNVSYILMSMAGSYLHFGNMSNLISVFSGPRILSLRPLQ